MMYFFWQRKKNPISYNHFDTFFLVCFCRAQGWSVLRTKNVGVVKWCIAFTLIVIFFVVTLIFFFSRNNQAIGNTMYDICVAWLLQNPTLNIFFFEREKKRQNNVQSRLYCVFVCCCNVTRNKCWFGWIFVCVIVCLVHISIVAHFWI